MALITVDGQDVLRLSASMPRAGAWTADLVVDDPDMLNGAVTIDISDGALRLVGTIARSGVFEDSGRVRVIAGAGGMGGNATPRQYMSASVRIVLADLLAAAGEALSATADASILATQLDAWTTAAVPVGILISRLLAAAAPGALWRMLPDGTCWVGRETWPDSGLDPGTYAILDDSAESGSMLIDVEAPLLLPGTTFEGRKVSRVDHLVSDTALQSCAWFEDAVGQAPTDRLKDVIGRLVRATPPGIDYRARYWARVVGQNPSLPNTIDVELENVHGAQALPNMGAVPLLLGIPGATVSRVVSKANRGGRVLVGWAAADPSQPYAESFDPNVSLTDGPGILSIAVGTAGVARVGDAVSLTLNSKDVAAIAASMVAAGLVLAGSGGPAPAPVGITGENVIASGSAIVKVG